MNPTPTIAARILTFHVCMDQRLMKGLDISGKAFNGNTRCGKSI
jgi:hypothetical protein